MPQRENIKILSGFDLLVERKAVDETVEVIILNDDKRRCLLHWGVKRDSRAGWQVPPEQTWPAGSRAYNHGALQTPFSESGGRGRIEISLAGLDDFSVLEFVLFFPDENRWDNNGGSNYRITLREREKTPLSDAPEVDRIVAEIIEKETGRNSWTLMHRFDLCYNLLDHAKDAEGMAVIFVWLRYSFIRQLDWQRNYNTKPRELGHSMDRLTLKLAERYVSDPGNREMIRLMLSTLGRGSDAQRVRDEVLNIMHRHHIKEVSGHFMEEWHQKLHNNTTPDDIVICEAYLDFLRNNGNMEKFYSTLEREGVSRERLRGYERPIRSDPDYIPHLRDALIGEFEHFLGILKSVHTGADLGTAIYAARYLFDSDMHSLMDFVWFHKDDRGAGLSALTEKITESRRMLANRFSGESGRVRDLLFLDIALEDFLRTAVEKNLGSGLGEDQLIGLTSLVLENLYLSNNDDDVLRPMRLWQKLCSLPRFGREWSLRAMAVLEGISQALGVFVDRFTSLLQPRAEYLGKAFNAAPWSVTLFAEEVMRGRPEFALSMLLHSVGPLLRKHADLGKWQIISRAYAAGRLEVVHGLKSVQGKTFIPPAIIVADNVSGNEEIPAGVAGIITSSVIDVLSHIAVRARNRGTLFATCYDPGVLQTMKDLQGKNISLSVNASGEVVFEEGILDAKGGPAATLSVKSLSRPRFTDYAAGIDEFSPDKVGGKSWNVKLMKGRLPEWIGIPPSAALPFGVFEKVLAGKKNKAYSDEYKRLTSGIEESERNPEEELAAIRAAVLKLEPPPELIDSLRAALQSTGLPQPSDWNEAWICIKKVWASKWNERAYLSRIANGTPHQDLIMAVLIQSVVEADYSFVIHTVNPVNNAVDEIYGEVVQGLGEALVGNYPGKALSFSCNKAGKDPETLSFPGKTARLSGGGLIFRSDSNGEDLAGFAGAGLYDSFILPAPKVGPADYLNDSLFWDDGFRKDFLIRLAEIGILVEEIFSNPQDIEGAYSKGRYYLVQSRQQVGLEK